MMMVVMPKTERLTAYKIDRDNLGTVARWCSGIADYKAATILFASGPVGFAKHAFIGDVIVMHSEGYFDVVRGAEFHHQYEVLEA